MKKFIFTITVCCAVNYIAMTQNNTSYGTDAFVSNTIGYRNVAFGDSVLAKNTEGFGNSAIGHKALKSNTTGEFNTALGGFTLTQTGNNYANTAIGYKSQELTTGHNNTSLGYRAFQNGVGYNNVAIGAKSMLTGGNAYNVGVGYSTLPTVQGKGNIAMGSYSLENLTTGSENVAFGHRSGQSLTTGQKNTIVGSYAYTNANSSFNIFIGYQSKVLSGNSNIVIGRGISLPAGSSYAMNIGGILFGSGLRSTNGKIGINVTNPTATLDVAGVTQTEKLLVNKPTTITNWNNVWQSGFYDSENATNAPESSIWFWGINMNHTHNSPTYRYGGQIAIRNSSTSPTMYFRSINANGNGTWAKVLHSVGDQQINGILRANEVRVCVNQGCDYVFADDYKLMSLSDLSSFVKTNKHLPEVAPAAIMETEGISLSEMNTLLLKKVEELTLYVIELKNEIDGLKR